MKRRSLSAIIAVIIVLIMALTGCTAKNSVQEMAQATPDPTATAFADSLPSGDGTVNAAQDDGESQTAPTAPATPTVPAAPAAEAQNTPASMPAVAFDKSGPVQPSLGMDKASVKELFEENSIAYEEIQYVLNEDIYFGYDETTFDSSAFTAKAADGREIYFGFTQDDILSYIIWNDHKGASAEAVKNAIDDDILAYENMALPTYIKASNMDIFQFDLGNADYIVQLVSWEGSDENNYVNHRFQLKPAITYDVPEEDAQGRLYDAFLFSASSPLNAKNGIGIDAARTMAEERYDGAASFGGIALYKQTLCYAFRFASGNTAFVALDGKCLVE